TWRDHCDPPLHPLPRWRAGSRRSVIAFCHPEQKPFHPRNPRLSSSGGPEEIQSEARLLGDRRAEGGEAVAKASPRRFPICHSETRRAPIALRFPAANGGRSQIMGAAKRLALAPRREASRGRSGRPSDRIRNL